MRKSTHQVSAAGAMTYHQALQICLPWPPSVNRYWRSLHRLKRVVISAEGRQYCSRVAALVSQMALQINLKGRLRVVVHCVPPDKRRRDLDNILKVLLDSLTKAGVWQDDSQIDELSVCRHQGSVPGCLEAPTEGKGMVLVQVHEAGAKEGQPVCKQDTDRNGSPDGPQP